MTGVRCVPSVDTDDPVTVPRKETLMRKYLVERTVPGAGQMDDAGLAAIAGTSNKVLRDLGPDIQWVQSYVADDTITCLYLAADEELIREHGRCGGFPVDAVLEVHTVIDPTTEEVRA
jgi:Nickel responsive protein SCO4226-like